jgi:sugar lactone lactonase YvrE
VPLSHSFAIEIDNGTTVLAEGVKSYAIVYGNNGTLTTLTLNGVAAVGASSFETCTTTSCSGSLYVIDPASYAIVNTTSPLAPGYDNGPLTLASTATAVGTVTLPAGGTVTQPSANGSFAYAVGCATSGTFFLTLAPHSTTGSGDITSAELANRALTYPAVITYGKTYSCSGTSINNAVYVGTNATTTANASVRIFTSTGAATPQATIVGTNTGLNAPQGVSVDASGRIFIANAGNSITVYAPNQSGTTNATPTGTITGTNTGMNGSQGIAEDLFGRIYVANNAGKSITVYAPNPVGTINEAPIETIKGGSTTLVNPVSVALDANGLIYVADAGGTDISIFPAYTTGGTVTAAPLATISGSNTKLSNPNGVALDASGRIYVADYGSNAITIYAAYTGAAIGNVGPVAAIVGAATGLLTPTDVALDPTGRIYVANYNNNGTGTVTVYAAYTGAALGNVAPLASITGLAAVWGITVH